MVYFDLRSTRRQGSERDVELDRSPENGGPGIEARVLWFHAVTSFKLVNQERNVREKRV